MFGQSNDKKHDDKYKVGNGPMGNPDFSNAVNELASKNDDGIHVGPAPSDPTPQGRSAQTPPPNWGHPGIGDTSTTTASAATAPRAYATSGQPILICPTTER